MTVLATALLVAVALLAAGCGSDDEGPATGATGAATTPAQTGGPPVAAAKVNIASFKYIPDPVVIRAGGPVTWTNQDVAPHTSTAEDLSVFNTDTLKKGQSKTVTIKQPGTYAYFCIFHRFMVGKVVVR